MNKSNHKTKSKFNLSRKVKSLQELANRNNENKAITKILIVAIVIFATIIFAVGYHFSPKPSCYREDIKIQNIQKKFFNKKSMKLLKKWDSRSI